MIIRRTIAGHVVVVIERVLGRRIGLHYRQRKGECGLLESLWDSHIVGFRQCCRIYGPIYFAIRVEGRLECVSGAFELGVNTIVDIYSDKVTAIDI